MISSTPRMWKLPFKVKELPVEYLSLWLRSYSGCKSYRRNATNIRRVDVVGCIGSQNLKKNSMPRMHLRKSRVELSSFRCSDINFYPWLKTRARQERVSAEETWILTNELTTRNNSLELNLKYNPMHHLVVYISYCESHHGCENYAYSFAIICWPHWEFVPRILQLNGKRNRPKILAWSLHFEFTANLHTKD